MGLREWCRFVMTKTKDSRAQHSKFHNWRTNNCDVDNGNFKLSYQLARWFSLLFGLAISQPTGCGIFAFVQGCLQHLKWYLNKGSFEFLLYISAKEKYVRAQHTRLSSNTKVKWSLVKLKSFSSLLFSLKVDLDKFLIIPGLLINTSVKGLFVLISFMIFSETHLGKNFLTVDWHDNEKGTRTSLPKCKFFPWILQGTNIQKSIILFSFIVSTVKEFIIAIKLMGWFFSFSPFSFLFC